MQQRCFWEVKVISKWYAMNDHVNLTLFCSEQSRQKQIQNGTCNWDAYVRTGPKFFYCQYCFLSVCVLHWRKRSQRIRPKSFNTSSYKINLKNINKVVVSFNTCCVYMHCKTNGCILCNALLSSLLLVSKYIGRQ